MILQLAVLLVSLGLVTALGLPVATKLQRTMPAMALATPAFGAAILGMVATIPYVWGLDIAIIAPVVAGLAALCLVLCRRTVLQGFGAIRHYPVAALLFLIFSLVIASPILVGAPEFSVFQGNQWDHFGYATSALIFSKLPFRAVVDAAPADLLANPLLAIAQTNCYQRPTVHIILAVIGKLLPGGIAGSGYALLCSFAIAGMFAAAGFLRQLFAGERSVPPAVTALLAGLCACGFWGQYPLDIDAWSQVAAAPLLIAAWAMALAMLAAPAEAAIDRQQIAALGLLIGGALYLYPEGCMFHALILAAVLVVAGRATLRRVRPLGLALALGLALPVLFWQGIYGQAVAQSQSAALKHVTWWRYFDGYLFGLDPQLNQTLQDQLSVAAHGPFLDVTQIGEPAAALLTGISGVFGMYFLTPEHYDAPTLRDAAKGALLVLALAGIVFGIGTSLRGGSRGYRLLLVATAAGLFGALLLAVQNDLWPAGKALSYVGPLLCLTVVAPMLLGRRGALWSLPWCLAQGGFIVLLLLGLRDPAGLRLPPPYPESQDLGLKTGGRWRIDQQMARLKSCPVVRIIAPEPFLRHYFAMSVYEAGLPYFYTDPVNSYFGSGKDIGTMTALPVPRHCEMVQRGAPRLEGETGPPAEIAGFPAGLLAPNLIFIGVSQDGWLAAKAHTRLWRPGGSDRLHMTGEIPDLSPQITGGTLKITVDGAVVLERPETAGAFDLDLPIPLASGPRAIDLAMSGTDHLPDGRLVSLQLHSMALERSAGASDDDDD